MDNSPIFSEKRYKMICQIQKFLNEGCSYREIAKRMGVGRNTIAKYREGDPKELSMYEPDRVNWTRFMISLFNV